MVGKFLRIKSKFGALYSGIDWAGNLNVVGLEAVAQYEAEGADVRWTPSTLKPDDYDELVRAKKTRAKYVDVLERVGREQYAIGFPTGRYESLDKAVLAERSIVESWELVWHCAKPEDFDRLVRLAVLTRQNQERLKGRGR